MIENIRKYTGLMIVTFVIIFISFFFLDTSSIRAMGGGRGVLKIDGRTYSDKEFQNLGSGGFQLASSLASSGDYGLFQFVNSLASGATNRDDAAEKFFIGRMIVRNAKDEFGVYPGEEEITEYIRKLRAFAKEDGQFDEEAYRKFIDRGIGRLGMTEADLRGLISDVLATQKISQIVGSGLGVNRDLVAATVTLENQQIAAELASLSIGPFEAKIEPTDEEIKEYWDTLQDSFTTEPLRQFTYLIATPDMPAEEADEEETPETIADLTLSDEARKAADQKKTEERNKKAAERAAERRATQLKLDSLVDDFSFKVEEEQGSNFEELAKENSWELVTTELFPQSAPPAELNVDLRASSRGGRAVDELFRIIPTADPISKFSQPIAIAENQWLVARLDKEEPSRPKTFEEAKEDARAQFIAEKATEAMKTAANEAAETIRKALADGKSFAEGAKEAGIEETKSLPKITATYTPDAATEPRNLFEAARYADPGSVTEPIIEADRAFILHVAKREVVRDDSIAGRIDSQVKSQVGGNEIIAFTGWITARTETAKVEQLYKQP